MAIFYKGVGVGTHLHGVDLRTTGLSPRDIGASHSVDSLLFHITNGTAFSPYVSLSRSFGVARDYAVNASRAKPSVSRPAYVYSIEIGPADGVRVLDAVCEIAKQNDNVFASPSYHHDGSQTFVLGVVDPCGMSAHLNAYAPQPTTAGGATRRPAILTKPLEAMVRAIRDAEIVVVGSVPRSCVRDRYAET